MLEMRGGACWNMSSAVVQQGGLPRPLGGYQPNLIVEPRSPATPWHMHHTVKQEPADEERNDSGITSGGSDLQSSPGSENSQDLNTQNYPASTGIIHHQQNVNPYYSTPIMPRALGTFENNTTNPTTPNVVSPKKQHLYQHLMRNDDEAKEATSPTPRASPTNLFKDDSEERQDETDPLRRLQMSLEKNGLLSALSPKMSETSIDGDNKSDIDLDEYDEQGLRMPKVNSHGKVKTFKCKQCDFIAITKLDFWEHSKSHIKTDKLLTCPKCPFVTEYKHHLEYHLRNHFGSKPFKCNKCSYSCVNKSMLNSHMKSHSNVYQYRCSDCSYATKYCHSLKLHLRKYSHKPAMVLNADGSPNPLPIIDVYGTRRGPKQKMHFKQDEVENPSSQMIQNSLTQFMLNPQLPLPFPYPFLGGFAGALGNPLLFQQNLVQMAQRRLGQEQERSEEDQERPDSPEEEKVTGSCGVLDLSKQEQDKTSEGEQPMKSRRKGVACKLDINAERSEDEEEDDNDDGAEENEEDEAPRNPHSNQVNDDLCSNSSIEEKMDTGEQPPNKEEVTNNNKPNNYSCQFCCISFGDVVLYTMHMGYHGYKDPFTCNMCGEQCNDKVSFFLHIARTSHS